MLRTRPLVVTMFLSTVPPVDCKCAAAAAGLNSRLAQSDRFVRLLSAPLVEQPGDEKVKGKQENAASINHCYNKQMTDL